MKFTYDKASPPAEHYEKLPVLMELRENETNLKNQQYGRRPISRLPVGGLLTHK